MRKILKAIRKETSQKLRRYMNHLDISETRIFEKNCKKLGVPRAKMLRVLIKLFNKKMRG